MYVWMDGQTTENLSAHHPLVIRPVSQLISQPSSCCLLGHVISSQPLAPPPPSLFPYIIRSCHLPSDEVHTISALCHALCHSWFRSDLVTWFISIARWLFSSSQSLYILIHPLKFQHTGLFSLPNWTTPGILLLEACVTEITYTHMKNKTNTGWTSFTKQKYLFIQEGLSRLSIKQNVV